MVAVQTPMAKDLHSRRSLHVWLFINRPEKLNISARQHSGSRSNS